MTCKRFEKMISDRMDGILSERDRDRLDDHLASCPSCAAYEEHLHLIRSAADSLKEDEILEASMHMFSSRLHDRLSRLKESAGRSRSMGFPRWAYAAVPVLFACVVFGYLFLTGPRDTTLFQERFVLSMEENMQRITQVIDADPELGSVFNNLLLSSIQESLGREEGYPSDGFETPSSFVNSLTEEELKILEAELKKQTTS